MPRRPVLDSSVGLVCLGTEEGDDQCSIQAYGEFCQSVPRDVVGDEELEESCELSHCQATHDLVREGRVGESAVCVARATPERGSPVSAERGWSPSRGC